MALKRKGIKETPQKSHKNRTEYDNYFSYTSFHVLLSVLIFTLILIVHAQKVFLSYFFLLIYSYDSFFGVLFLTVKFELTIVPCSL